METLTWKAQRDIIYQRRARKKFDYPSQAATLQMYYGNQQGQ